ncbi:MAG: PH domain-containing protein [Acidimicrobiales bacterium]|nr:PH domain-containing protein [Acidimicrobiales bacterium]
METWETGTSTHPTANADLAEVNRLSGRVVWFWRLHWGIPIAFLVLLTFLFGANGQLVGTSIWGLATVLTVLAAFWVTRRRYQRWTFRVTEDRLELRHGLFIRHESSIPHFRVQHVDLRQGPLERMAGVVAVQISTASPATDAVLPALEPERAEMIRALVLSRVEADDAV